MDATTSAVAGGAATSSSEQKDGDGVAATTTESKSNFNADTFLTNIRDEGVTARRSISIADPQSLSRVHDLYGKVGIVVGSLQEKMKGVLRKQEGEFLTAYRAHMYNIQKELQDLRAKVDEEELQMKKDAVLKQLQGEREWYRNEALRLDTFVTNMKKDIEYMKEKLENVEDDRNWLEKQLKTSKKQNKILKVKLQELGAAEEKDTSVVSPRSTVRATHQPAKRAPSSSARANGYRGSKPSSRQKSRGKALPSDLADVRGDLPLPKQLEELRDRNRILKIKLDEEKLVVKQLRAEKVESGNKKGELEKFFVQCVDDVKKSVQRRKAAAATRGHSASNGLPKMGRKAGKKSREISLTPKPVHFSEVKSKDRVDVLHKFLATKGVLSFIFDSLFGENPEITDAFKEFASIAPGSMM